MTVILSLIWQMTDSYYGPITYGICTQEQLITIGNVLIKKLMSAQE